jgi:endonuclease/exonuclease/phosphatase family metal-dependent hydrolase
MCRINLGVVIMIILASLNSAQGGYKILSLNLHCFENNWASRLELLSQQIAIISPDIISFQEVCTSPSDDMIKSLEANLSRYGHPRMQTYSLFTHMAWNKYREHLVVMAKRQVQNQDLGLLPESPLRRGYIALEVDGQWFINTHLEYLDPRYRGQQIAYLIGHFRNRPHIVMGDFNSNPASTEQQLFSKEKYTSVFPGPTFPTPDLKEALDGFWLSTDMAARYGRRSGTVLFKQACSSLLLSDHAGVLLELL